MLKRLTPRVSYLKYEHYADRPSLGYIRGNTRSLMFDAGGSPAHVAAYLHALRQAELPAPDYAAVSHWHNDHVLGMCALSIPVLACDATNARLEEMTHWSWDDRAIRSRIARHEESVFGYEMLKNEYGDCSAVRVRTADLVFSERMTVDLGGVTCELVRVGGPHSPDSVVCLVKQERVLFLGDSHGKDMLGLDWTYDPAHRENLRPALAALPYDTEKLAAYRGTLEKLDFDVCVGGHEDPMSKSQLLALLSLV